MRTLLYAILGVGFLSAILVGFGAWKYYAMFPPTSQEVIRLGDHSIRQLKRLRAEAKFQPNNFPPLGYTGPDTPADGVIASDAVNTVIDAILVRSDQPVRAAEVSKLYAAAGKKVRLLATEDRDRMQGYLLEIWYIIGFKGATGQFAYGAAFPKPPGYGEPLPPGWKSPTEPRAIGN